MFCLCLKTNIKDQANQRLGALGFQSKYLNLEGLHKNIMGEAKINNRSEIRKKLQVKYKHCLKTDLYDTTPQNYGVILLRMTHIVSLVSQFLTSFTKILSVEPHSPISWEKTDQPSYKCKKINVKITVQQLLCNIFYFKSLSSSYSQVKYFLEI